MMTYSYKPPRDTWSHSMAQSDLMVISIHLIQNVSNLHVPYLCLHTQIWQQQGTCTKCKQRCQSCHDCRANVASERWALRSY